MTLTQLVEFLNKLPLDQYGDREVEISPQIFDGRKYTCINLITKDGAGSIRFVKANESVFDSHGLVPKSEVLQ